MGYINKVTIGSDTHLIEPTLYGTSTTAAGTGTKVVTIDSNFTLVTGVRIDVKFSETNSAAASGLKLNVNSTGAKAVKCNGSNLIAGSLLVANYIHSFIYDGTNWEYMGPSMIRQAVSSTTSWRNILLGTDTNTSAAASASENYGPAYMATGVSVQPSNGALYASSIEPHVLTPTAQTGTLHTTQGTFPFAIASTDLLTDIINSSVDYAGLQIGSSADTWQLVAHSNHLYIRQNNTATTSNTWSSGWTSWEKIVNSSDLGTAASLDASVFYRLKGGTVIENHSDLNTYKTIGNYYQSTNRDADDISNGPTTTKSAFTMKVTSATGSGTQYLKQIFQNYNSHITFSRYSNNTGSSWGNWYFAPIMTGFGTKKGDTNKPIYISSTGIITEGTELKDLAYIDKPSTDTTIKYLRGDGTWTQPQVKIAGQTININDDNGLSAASLRTALNLESALRFIGTTTSTMSESFNGVPAGITGYTTPSIGDVVLDSDTEYEYVCINKTTSNDTIVYTWEQLGSSSSYSLSTHTHGEITNDGKVPTANRILISDSSNAITTSQLLSFSYSDNNGTLNIGLDSSHTIATTIYGTFTIPSMGTGSDNIFCPIWFMGSNNSSVVNGRPVSSTNLTFNPNTKTLKIGTATVTESAYSGSAATLTSGKTLKVSLSNTNASTAFDGSANITDIGVSGTLAIANGGTGKSNDAAINTVFAGPSSGNPGAPSWRALVAADIPNLSWNKITSDKPTTVAGYGITDAAAAVHNHGNLTSDGKIGSTANYAVYTTTDGAVTAGSLAVTDDTTTTITATATTFVSAVTQDSKGQITVTKKNLLIDAAGGVASYGHTHSYLPLSGGDLTGNLVIKTASNAHGATPYISFQRQAVDDQYTDWKIYSNSSGKLTISSSVSGTTSDLFQFEVPYSSNSLIASFYPVYSSATLGTSSSEWTAVYATTFYGDLNGNASTLSHTLATTTKYYISGTTLSATGTSAATFDTGIYSTTTAGELSAVDYSLNISGTEKAKMIYNSTDDTIDFVFI